MPFVQLQGEQVALEPFIYGEYDKFTSNSGWTAGEHNAPDAFTHYTWHKTKELIVCDLQGVRQVRCRFRFALLDREFTCNTHQISHSIVDLVGVYANSTAAICLLVM